MRTILLLIVVSCSLSHSNATLRLLKSKVNASPILQRAIQYLAAPEPLPAAFARPSYTTHVSSFSVALPPVAATLGVPPHVHETYAAPVLVHPETLPLVLPPPQPHYHGPEAVVVEPFVGHVVEEHFNEHYAGHLPLRGQIGNW